MKRCTFDDIKGGDPKYNAQTIRDIFSGRERGPKRDMLLLNSAAAFVVGGKATNLGEGLALAKSTLDSGRATAKLAEIVTKSQALKSKN